MKELIEFSERLKKELDKKEKELQEKVDCSGYLLGYLENRRRDVKAFKDSIKNVTKDPFLKNEVIENYAVKAKEIIGKIRQIN